MNARSEFDKDFYKLMNNSVFGKLMENVRDRMRASLETKWDRVRKMIANPTFIDCTVIKEELVFVEMQQSTVKFDKAIFAGASILDQSKILMYDFHYNTIHSTFGGNNVQLLYCDTDSFIYCIRCDDLYSDLCFGSIQGRLDLSSYPQDHRLYNVANKKVVGKFKDELDGKIITEFVGLSSKLYSFKTCQRQEVKKAKGVNRVVINREMSFNDYKTCLNESIEFYRQMNNIVSSNHLIRTVQMNKRVLFNFDDKRVIKADGKGTYSFGHYEIVNDSSSSSSSSSSS
uniref:DNA-directed DNA polymerase n=1 Tax=Cacopsylla melanoneura TaxID=428564 RepID=A0A8D8VQD4_9HEMI